MDIIDGSDTVSKGDFPIFKCLKSCRETKAGEFIFEVKFRPLKRVSCSDWLEKCGDVIDHLPNIDPKKLIDGQMYAIIHCVTGHRWCGWAENVEEIEEPYLLPIERFFTDEEEERIAAELEGGLTDVEG